MTRPSQSMPADSSRPGHITLRNPAMTALKLATCGNAEGQPVHPSCWADLHSCNFGLWLQLGESCEKESPA